MAKVEKLHSHKYCATGCSISIVRKQRINANFCSTQYSHRVYLLHHTQLLGFCIVGWYTCPNVLHHRTQIAGKVHSDNSSWLEYLTARNSQPVPTLLMAAYSILSTNRNMQDQDQPNLNAGMQNKYNVNLINLT